MLVGFQCAYAKQLCGYDLYRQIQEYKRARTGVPSDANIATNSGQLHIPDESTLSRLVAARVDLPITQSLLNQNYGLNITEECWEDQLQLKRKLMCCARQSRSTNTLDNTGVGITTSKENHNDPTIATTNG
jgi:hypothetical protein